jgi:hypothetical protein
MHTSGTPAENTRLPPSFPTHLVSHQIHPTTLSNKRVRESINGANPLLEKKSFLVWLYAAFRYGLNSTYSDSRVPLMDWVHCGKVPTDKPLLPSDPVNPSFLALWMAMALAQTKHRLGGFPAIFRGWFPRFPEVLIIPLGIV